MGLVRVATCEHPNVRRARNLRWWLAFLFACALALGLAYANPARAFAADDQIDSFAIKYVMQPSGVLDVRETIVWRFGSNSGRHGINRDLVTREQYDQANDAVYDISNVDVSSPSGAPTSVDKSTTEQNNGRTEILRLRIGDPDKTVSADTATYVISYQVKGAMRSFSGYDEFYWDATGFGNPAIKKLQISATVPGGPQELTCFAGPVQSKNECDSKTILGDTATFSQGNLAAETGVTIGVKIGSGLVSDNKPHLEPDGSKMSTAEKVGIGALVGVGALFTIGSPLLGWLWWRKNGVDQRYTNLAPGTLPLPGAPVEIGANDPDLPIPVAFSPPKIPVAEAGLLIDGQVDARETAATIIDLAVKGALTVQSSSEKDFSVTLVDPNRATAPHEMVLLTSLFGGRPPGAVADLSAQGSMLPAHKAMTDSVRNQVASRGWFRKVPSASSIGGIGFGGIAIGVFIAFSIGATALLFLLPLLPIVITIAVIRSKLRRGQRTADGRAVCDQVEGFKTYLATAEAEQLQFEEGEDIFSKYLPWAIAFELADRWAKICGDLVAMGRLPNTTPYWYVGNYNMAAFNTAFLTSSLTHAATPVPSSSGGGTGFGGGSSFGGGGFSGGGGGGGGSSSW
ncbi:hypothetical protein GCM10009841_29190 [Microlunatus panaciterrae]|nr:DUF2207 domain-containing protein [Microlunatus panaciterrae]